MKVDLTRDECDAIAELAEIAVHQFLKNRAALNKAEQDRLRAIINSVRMKMSISVSMLAPANIITRAI